MKNLIYTFVIGMTFLIVSCEGFRVANGMVVDAETNLPIDSVECHATTSEMIDYTDSLGNYYVQNRIGGCMNECADIVVEYKKEGYKTKTLTNPSNSTIRLEKK